MMDQDVVLSLLDKAKKEIESNDVVSQETIEEFVKNPENIEMLIQLFLTIQTDLMHAMYELNCIASLAINKSNHIEQCWFKKPDE